LAIFLFGYFFGFFGVLLAVPLSAFLVEVLRRYLAQREAATASLYATSPDMHATAASKPEEEVKEF